MNLSFGTFLINLRERKILNDRKTCLLYTSDAADERSSVDLGGRRIIKKKNSDVISCRRRVDSKKHKRRVNKKIQQI